MSANGKPVTKHMHGIGTITSYEDVPDFKETNMNQPMPAPKMASQGENKTSVGDEYHTRAATAEEMKSATAGAIAAKLGPVNKTATSAPMTRSDVLKSIVGSVEAVQKARGTAPKMINPVSNPGKNVAVDASDEFDQTFQSHQDEASEGDADEAMKPTGVKMREDNRNPKTVADPGDDVPVETNAHERNRTPHTIQDPKHIDSHYQGAPAKGKRTTATIDVGETSGKQPSTPKSMTAGDEVYVPAVRSNMTISAIFEKSETVEVTDGKRTALVSKSDLMPISQGKE